MGSQPDLITIEEAAELLGQDPKHIHQLCADGRIRRTRVGDAVLVPRGDVIEVRRMDLGTEDPTERILALEHRVARLESALTLLFDVMNMGKDRFGPMSRDQLEHLYSQACLLDRERSWDLPTLIGQAETFIRITETELVRINRIVSVDDSWRPFFNLCLRMLQHVQEHPELGQNLELQRARALLLTGRDNLRLCATLLIERAHRTESSEKVLARVAAVDLDAFDVLIRKHHSDHQWRRTDHLRLLDPAKSE